MRKYANKDLQVGWMTIDHHSAAGQRVACLDAMPEQTTEGSDVGCDRDVWVVRHSLPGGAFPFSNLHTEHTLFEPDLEGSRQAASLLRPKGIAEGEHVGVWRNAFIVARFAGYEVRSPAADRANG